MTDQFDLSPAEHKRMMHEFDVTSAYEHEPFGKLISGNTDIRSLLESANIHFRALKHLDDIFEKPLDEDQRTYFKTVITFELVMKTMHSIECLSALLAAYTERNPRFHEAITRYNLDDDAIKILTKARKRKLPLREVQDLFGFPADGGIRKKMMEDSCKRILVYLNELADYYFSLREAYRRYKHGHPFGLIKWLREEGGKEVGYIPLMIFVDQDKVKKNRNKSGPVWQFGVNFGGFLPFDPEDVFNKIRIVYNLFFIAKYNCHMRTFFPGLDMTRLLLPSSGGTSSNK